MEDMKEKTEEVQSVEQVPTLLWMEKIWKIQHTWSMASLISLQQSKKKLNYQQIYKGGSIMMIADRHTFCWKWEDNQNKPFHDAHSEIATNTFCTALCHINTFTLNISKHNLAPLHVTLTHSHYTAPNTIWYRFISH